MGYRIEYDSRGGKYEVRRHNFHSFWIVFGSAVGLFLLLTFAFWTEGAEYIRDALIPGDNQVTAAAIRNLTEDLRQGVKLHDAVEAFCMDVIHGAASSN